MVPEEQVPALLNLVAATLPSPFPDHALRALVFGPLETFRDAIQHGHKRAVSLLSLIDAEGQPDCARLCLPDRTDFDLVERYNAVSNLPSLFFGSAVLAGVQCYQAWLADYPSARPKVWAIIDPGAGPILDALPAGWFSVPSDAGTDEEACLVERRDTVFIASSR